MQPGVLVALLAGVLGAAPAACTLSPNTKKNARSPMSLASCGAVLPPTLDDHARRRPRSARPAPRYGSAVVSTKTLIPSSISSCVVVALWAWSPLLFLETISTVTGPALGVDLLRGVLHALEQRRVVGRVRALERAGEADAQRHGLDRRRCSAPPPRPAARSPLAAATRRRLDSPQADWRASSAGAAALVGAAGVLARPPRRRRTRRRRTPAPRPPPRSRPTRPLMVLPLGRPRRRLSAPRRRRRRGRRRSRPGSPHLGGRPSPIVRPSASTWMRSQSRMISRRSWSTMTIVHPPLLAHAPDGREQAVGLGLVHARRGLVQQQQAAARRPARGRSPPAAAGRRRASPRQPVARRPRARAAPAPPVTPVDVAAAGHRADRDVLRHGHLAEQADLLERARRRRAARRWCGGRPSARWPAIVTRPAVGRSTPDDHVQQRRLAASRWARSAPAPRRSRAPATRRRARARLGTASTSSRMDRVAGTEARQSSSP